MRHLKRYNESREVNIEFDDSVNLDNVVSDLKDILIDVIDLGFWTDVKANNYVITITISRLRSEKGFIRNSEEFDSIRSVLQRFKNYAKENNFNIDDTWLNRLNNLGDFNKFMDDNRWTMYITIYPPIFPDDKN